MNPAEEMWRPADFQPMPSTPYSLFHVATSAAIALALSGVVRNRHVFEYICAHINDQLGMFRRTAPSASVPRVAARFLIACGTTIDAGLTNVRKNTLTPSAWYGHSFGCPRPGGHADHLVRHVPRLVLVACDALA